jgi:hypothetical protein
MLKIIARAVLAIEGALALFATVSIWLDPEGFGAQLGVAPIGDLGLSTIRGDIGALFAGAGIFMIGAAITQDRRLIIPPLVYTALALSARTFSLAVTAYSPELLRPMLVEGISIAILTAAYVILGQAPAESAAVPTSEPQA